MRRSGSPAEKAPRSVRRVLPYLFLLASAVTARAAIPPRQSDAACLACHGPGAKGSAVEVDLLRSSAHGGLTCADCHAIPPGTGEAGRPHARKLPDVDCTARCHREPAAEAPGKGPLFYPDSVHGRDYAQSRTTQAAKCWDCHGRHGILGIADPKSSVNRRNIPVTCSRCHEDMEVVLKYNIHREAPYQEYLKSVHGTAAAGKDGVSFAAVCTDCHGAHDIQGVGRGEIAARKPETCGRCHGAILAEYENSIHGQAARRGIADAPVCVDCHGEHTIASPRQANASTSAGHIADTCSTCHARPEVMRKYGIPADKTSTFIDSLHGIAVGLGYKAAANCTSCHGVHEILPAADPRSPVNPAHLARTCGQPKCHPGMPARISQARVHLDAGKRSSGAIYWAQTVLLGLILLATLITLAWFIPGFIRRAKLIRKRK